MSDLREPPPPGYLLTELGYIDELEVAAGLNVAPKTLIDYRKNGCGPQYAELARRILYSKTALAEWLANGGTKQIASCIIALFVLLSPLSALAATRVIDGDTLDIDGIRIRILEIDTLETWRPHCANLAAKEQLRELLGDGEVTFKTTGLDRYGRTLASVYAGDINVGEQLLKEKHTLPYIAGENEGRADCGVVRIRRDRSGQPSGL